jgi:FlaA1/EpsC-like NDP-sugar epimerase
MTSSTQISILVTGATDTVGSEIGRSEKEIRIYKISKYRRVKITLELITKSLKVTTNYLE